MLGFLRRNTWLVPLSFALALGAAGYSALSALEEHERDLLRSQLETTVASAQAALEIWTVKNEQRAVLWASDVRVRELTARLAEVARRAENPNAALIRAPELAELRSILDPVVEHSGLMGWGLQASSGMMIGAQTGLDHYLGFRATQLSETQQRSLAGSIEHTAPMIFEGPRGQYATMIAGAPVQRPKNEIGTALGLPGSEEKPIASLGFTMNPALEFARPLEVARHGSSGETYAFDANGVMVSPSRFEEQLRGIGLLPEDPEILSALTIQIRDPGGDMTGGFAPTTPLTARALTLAAASAIEGTTGSNLDGYRDYRGVDVVGAWTWLPKLYVGLASEIDVGEAYAGLAMVRMRFAILLGLLMLAALSMLGYTLVLTRLRGEFEDTRELGRYKLERKLGEGGMGSVYLAKHALLRRPTAIKVLNPEAAGDEGVTRFEREVQVSSSLTHPNTIQIFDFGTADDGTFYYAMEHVSGLNLSKLVESEGAVPEPRVLHILKQAAGSLAEAHDREIVHRDVKPANLMLCERGGLFDFVKVLDFGLVRLLGLSEDLSITKTQNLTGTPLYLAPESIEDPKSVGARSDVYQLGAVAYFLLAGRPPFEGESLVEVLGKHMRDLPEPLAEVCPSKVSPELDAIVMRCLEKKAGDRFADAGDLLAALEACPAANDWKQAHARAWWAQWADDHPEVAQEHGASLTSGPRAVTIDVVTRMGSPKKR